MKNLAGTWIHSFEEDTSTEKVFRPETYEFPLTRQPRERLTIQSSGTIIQANSFEDDRPTGEKKICIQEGKTLRIFGDTDTSELKIVEAEPEVLKIEK